MAPTCAAASLDRLSPGMSPVLRMAPSAVAAGPVPPMDCLQRNCQAPSRPLAARPKQAPRANPLAEREQFRRVPPRQRLAQRLPVSWQQAPCPQARRPGERATQVPKGVERRAPRGLEQQVQQRQARVEPPPRAPNRPVRVELPPQARPLRISCVAARACQPWPAGRGLYCRPFPQGRCSLRGECCGRHHQHPAAEPRPHLSSRLCRRP